MKIKILIISLILLLLSSCYHEPYMFGMPESQFRSLNLAQQQQVIAAYNQRQLVKTQNEPLNSLVGVAGQAVQQLGNRNNNPPPAPPSPSIGPAPFNPGIRPGFPDMPPRPSFPSAPPISPADFKPGECHQEGNATVCHHHEETHSHSSSSSGGFGFR